MVGCHGEEFPGDILAVALCLVLSHTPGLFGGPAFRSSFRSVTLDPRVHCAGRTRASSTFLGTMKVLSRDAWIWSVLLGTMCRNRQTVEYRQNTPSAVFLHQNFSAGLSMGQPEGPSHCSGFPMQTARPNLSMCTDTYVHVPCAQYPVYTWLHPNLESNSQALD